MYTIQKSSSYQQAEKTYKSALGSKRLAKMEAQLAENPTFKPGTIEMMKGQPSVYRYRIGEFRVIYEVIDGQVTVLLLDLGPRGSIYS